MENETTVFAFLGETGRWVMAQLPLDGMAAEFTVPWPSAGAAMDGIAYAIRGPRSEDLSAAVGTLPTPAGPSQRAATSLLPTPGDNRTTMYGR